MLVNMLLKGYFCGEEAMRFPIKTPFKRTSAGSVVGLQRSTATLI